MTAARMRLATFRAAGRRYRGVLCIFGKSPWVAGSSGPQSVTVRRRSPPPPRLLPPAALFSALTNPPVTGRAFSLPTKPYPNPPLPPPPTPHPILLAAGPPGGPAWRPCVLDCVINLYTRHLGKSCSGPRHTRQPTCIMLVSTSARLADGCIVVAANGVGVFISTRWG